MNALPFEIAGNFLAHLPDAPLHGAAAQKNSQMFLAMRIHGHLPGCRSGSSLL